MIFVLLQIQVSSSPLRHSGIPSQGVARVSSSISIRNKSNNIEGKVGYGQQGGSWLTDKNTKRQKDGKGQDQKTK